MEGGRSISLALIANPGSGSGEAESVSERLRAEGADVRTFPPSAVDDGAPFRQRRQRRPGAGCRQRGWIAEGRAWPLAYSIGALRRPPRPSVRCAAGCEGTKAFSGLAWQITVACSGAFGGGASLDADPPTAL